MRELVLVRIDDRLIHGQVITAWVKVTNADTILIVDNAVAADDFLAKVLKMAAPPRKEVVILNIEESIKYLKEEESDGRVLLLVKSPQTIYEMQEGGVSIKEVNLGGMGAQAGRKKLYKNISISDEDRTIFKKILDAGTKVYIKIVPDDKEKLIDNLL